MRIPYSLVFLFIVCAVPMEGLRAAESCRISDCSPFVRENPYLAQIINAAESYQLSAVEAYTNNNVNGFSQAMADYGNAVYSALTLLAVTANSSETGGSGLHAPTKACCLALSQGWHEQVTTVKNLASTYTELYEEGQAIFPTLQSALLAVYYASLQSDIVSTVVNGINQVGNTCDCEE